MNKKPTQNQTTQPEPAATPSEKPTATAASGMPSGSVPRQVAEAVTAPAAIGKAARKWRQEEEEQATLSLSQAKESGPWVTLEASAGSDEAELSDAGGSDGDWLGGYHTRYSVSEETEGLLPTGQGGANPSEDGNLIRVAASAQGAGEGSSVSVSIEEPVAALPKALPPVAHGAESGAAGQAAGLGEWFLPALAIGGGLALGGLGGGGGGGSAAAAGGVNINVGGLFVGGPVLSGNGLRVQMLDSAGHVLADQALTADGQFSLSGINYVGVFTLRVYDTNTANDQYDEAAGPSSLGTAEFHAAGVLTAADNGQTVFYNVNFYTDAAYAQASGMAGGLTAGNVTLANQNVGTALGGIDILGAPITTVVDTNGNPVAVDTASIAGRYGIWLAAAAGADFNIAGNSDVIVGDIASGTNNGTMTASLVAELLAGAQSVGANVYAALLSYLGNQEYWWITANPSASGEETGELSFTVSRVGALGASSIDVASVGGTASVGTDYTAVNQTLNFAAGETSKTIHITVNNDSNKETNETVIVAIRNPATGSIATGTATATILDDDQSIWSISTASATVDEGAGFITYVVSRTGDLSAASIDFSTAGGTATAGSDYTAISNQTLNFAAGETSKTIQVAIIDDGVGEGNETVVGAISGASTGTIVTNTATTTINDNDQSNWSVAAGSANVNEGAGFITYIISRTGGTNAATIDFATAGGTATAGSDYTALNQTLSFAAGEMTKTVRVTLTDDAVRETNETVVGSISGASSGSISTGTATVTVLDNEQANWTISTDPNGVDEGAGYITYVISRTGNLSAASVDFSTAGGTATAGADYTALSQTLSFAAGEASKTIQVALNNDSSKEANETVVGTISNVQNGTPGSTDLISTSTATATILDNDQSIWSVSAATATVDEGAGFITYVVSRTGDLSAATINFSTAGGTATKGVDYTGVNQTLSFADGETSKTIQVAITDDGVSEGNETVVGSISGASSGSILTNTATATITDNDQSVWVISAPSTSIDEGAGFITYIISRTGGTNAATIDFATAGGTATAGSDYTALNQTLSFAAGEMTKTVRVTLTDDAVRETNETVVGSISGASSGSISTGTATVTVLDNEQANWTISTDPNGVDEGAGYITYVISRTGNLSAASVDFATAGGTATAGADYTALSQTLSFAAGEASKTIQVALNNDSSKEANETLVGTISNVQNGTPGSTDLVSTSTATATILDNDQSIWSVSAGAWVDEGAGYISYIVSRTGDLSAATIDFATVSGTATAGADYTALSQTLSFAAGESSKTVRVAIIDDPDAETYESVVGAISGASSGSILTNTASNLITDNDQSNWSIAAGSASVNEGAGFITYIISRTGGTNAATIDFATAGGTATAGSDYTVLNQTLSFAAGEMAKTVRVTLTDDAVRETNETVVGSISGASSGSITTGTATVTVLDNEQANWTISTDPNGVDEGAGYITYVVSRTGTLSAATVDFATAGGTATAVVDYTALNQTLSFAAGEASKTVLVAINNDSSKEANETVVGSISNVQNSTPGSSDSISTAAVTATILDNDQSVWSVSALPGFLDEGSGYISYIVSRTGDLSAATIDFATAGGTATAGADYTALSQTLSFADGESSKTVWVAINDDTAPEVSEIVVGAISGASTGTIATNTATVSIFDNDQSSWIIADASNGSGLGEGAGYITYTVSRRGVKNAATIDFATAGGTATAGSDYTALSQTLSFAAGENLKTVRVALTDDTALETNETLVGSISGASSGSIQTGTATVTILDNDQSVWSVSADATTSDEGAGFINYVVSRTGDLSAATIDFATQGGSATAGVDYTALSQTLSFAAGESSKTVRVAIIDDSVLETNETVLGVISGASSGSILLNQAGASFADNDQSVWFIKSDSTSIDEGAGFITYIVYRSGGTNAATIDFATAGGTATAGSDYTVLNQTLSFAAGEMSKTVRVELNDDLLPEGNETVVGSISGASSGSIYGGWNTATVNLLDNDQSIWSIAGASTGFDEGAGFITYTVSRTGGTGAATIEFATAGGTATAGSDYTALNQTLSFAAGEMSKTVRVTLTDDAVRETNETVVGSISGASSGSILNNTATVSILDNEQSVWAVSAASTTVNEGAGYISYVVSRTGSLGAATIDFATAGGTATAGVGKDYTALSQTLSFADGESSKTVRVAINDDTAPEVNETVVGAISGASSGSIATVTAAVTILDNDQSIWSVSSSASTVDEGAGKISFTVSRTGDGSAATIDFSTEGGTATGQGVDYTAAALQTLSFAAGEMSKTITIDVVDDGVVEMNETLYGTILNASAGTISSAAATATILDNDQSIWSVSKADVVEAAGATYFTVSRTGSLAAAVISFDTVDGSAIAGQDYTAVHRLLTFAAGEASKTIDVAITNDADLEVSEGFSGVISNPTTGSLAVSNTTVTISDDDLELWSLDGASAVDEGCAYLVVTVSRNGSLATVSTINLATQGSTALAGSDFTAVNQTLTFAVGEQSKQVLIPIIDDAAAEPDETFTATISNASTGSIIRTSWLTSRTITDNDQTLWSVSLPVSSVDEGSGAVYFQVTRTGDISTATTIDFATAGGTATAGADYTALNQTLNFAAGESTKVVRVLINDDASKEIAETLIGVIGNAASGTITTASATATLNDNDQMQWSINVAPLSTTEAVGVVYFIVSRTGPLTAADIDVATCGGTAEPGADYTPLSQTLHFAEGETSKIVAVTVTNDNLPEEQESISASISKPTLGSIGSSGNLATVTIADTPGVALWQIGAGISNYDEGAGYVTFLVWRDGDRSAAATIDFQTATGTAIPGQDYTAVAQTLSFAAGEWSKTIRVAITEDAVAEGTENFGGYLSNASTGTIVYYGSAVSIIDNDQMSWAVSAVAGSVMENAGKMAFTIQRTGNLSAAASIEYATTGAASATGGVDYGVVAPTTLSFAAGEASKTIYITVNDDVSAEGDESVYLGIANASAGTITTALAATTITDDEVGMRWSLGSVGGTEGGQLVYTVKRSGDVSAAAEIDFSTYSTTSAQAGLDYTAVSQHLSFAAGESVKTVFVQTLDDSLVEGTETVSGMIGNASQGVITSASASATLTDDEVGKAVFSISPGGTVYEGPNAAALFVITRTGDMSKTVTMDYYLTGGTATAGTDYTGGTGTVTFAAGASQMLVSVPLVNDATSEASETLIMGLKNLSSGDYAGGTATTTINDDDTVVATTTYAVNGPSAYESAGTIQFTITRSGINPAETTYFRINGGTATAGVDYTDPGTLALSWAQGETSKSVWVNITNDGVLDTAASETLIAQLSATNTFGTGLASGTGSIKDSQAAAAATTFAVAVTSSAQEGGAVLVTVTRAGDVTLGATSYLHVSGGTAVAGTDYIDPGLLTLNWVGGETTKTVVVQLPEDPTPEAAKTLIFQSATNNIFTTGATTATATIYDNDWSIDTTGAADSITFGTAGSGGTAWYTGSMLVDTGAGNDTVSVASTADASQIVLGSGDDLLSATGTLAAVLSSGKAHYAGGSGVDTLQFTMASQTLDLAGTLVNSYGSVVQGFEVIKMAANSQTLKLSLQDVLDITTGNSVADTLKIIATGTSDSLQILAAGKTLVTVAAGSTIKDVDGSDLTVSASAAGNAACNDVNIGGTVYDVYQYTHDGHTLNLLVQANGLTTTVI